MTFANLKNQLQQNNFCARIAIAEAEGEEVFTALKQVESFCFPLLVGNKDKIEPAAKKANLANYKIIATKNSEESATTAVQLVRQKHAHTLMKSNVSSAIFLRAILNSKEGLRTGNLLSHICLFESADASSGFFAVTDGGINIQPDIKAKIAIINNAITLFHHLDVTRPKVAVLSAIETVNQQIPSTLDAANLAEMGAKGKFPGAIINGPLSLDLAISPNARKIKHYEHLANSNADISNADILVVPEIVSGNILNKALIYFAKIQSAGIVLGAIHPIIMLSRSDTAAEKQNSIILGAYLCSIF